MICNVFEFKDMKMSVLYNIHYVNKNSMKYIFLGVHKSMYIAIRLFCFMTLFNLSISAFTSSWISQEVNLSDSEPLMLTELQKTVKSWLMKRERLIYLKEKMAV